MFKKSKDAILRIFNFFVPKVKNSIYVNLGPSSVKNCEDILNFSGENAFAFIRKLIEKKFEKRIVIYIAYYFDDRLELYHELAKSALANNIELRFVKNDFFSNNKFGKMFQFLKKHYYVYKTKIWLVTTGDYYLYGKLNSQKIIDLNYFISCKNDFISGKNLRWSFLDGILTTSLLHSTTVSAQTGVKYDNCLELGFPRNDTLFQRKKETEIHTWLNEALGYTPKKIIVYAPTYRDYEMNAKHAESRFLFGYPVDFLEDFLKRNQYCMVCKLHNLATESILKYPAGVIDFKYCFDFSFYDLMSVSDCVITDYSSLGYDFMLLDKPLIYNLYDYDKYVEDRGVSYEPYDEYCPGVIVQNSAEMSTALENLASGIDDYQEKRHRLTKIFHKYPDGNSAERCVQYFCDRFELK